MLIILFTPMIFTIMGIKTEPTTENEKKISLNFKRNFPLKEDLFKLYRDVKVNFFKTDPIPNRVIDLNNGWKFLGNDFSNALSESKGLLNFSQKELNVLKTKLAERKNWLDKQNIKFYLAVAPNKHTYYGDMIPIKKKNKPTKANQVDSLCNLLGINYIDLGSKFPKDKSLRLYHKTDTHWNDYGGFFAYQATFEAFERDFKNTNFNTYKLEDLELVINNEPIGDLNGMLFLKKSEDYIRLKFKTPYKARLLEKKLSIPFKYNKDPKKYETRYETDINDLKILIFNDSFFGYYSKYLKENFGNSVFIWNYKFDKEIIASEKPDILYHEILERDLDVLLED